MTLNGPPPVDEAYLVDLARELTAIPSHATNELAVAEVIYRELHDLDIEIDVQELVSGRANLIARVPGAGTRKPLVLSGHLDAALSDGWSRDPYDPWVEDGRLYGAGVDDMKGAVACMVATVRAAAMAPTPLPGDLVLHAVMHHDTIGLGEKYALIAGGPSEGYAICGEPSGLAIHTANGGAIKFSVSLQGRTAHISRMEEGRDALAAAVDAYDALRELEIAHTPCVELQGLPRLVMGTLSAGADPAKVAAHAVLKGDIRTVPGMEHHDVHQTILDAARAACRDSIDIDVRITAVQQPFIGAREGHLIDTIGRVHADVLGSPPVVRSRLPEQAYVTDAADLARHGLETVVYGPGTWVFGPNQHVEVAELMAAARIYLGVAMSL